MLEGHISKAFDGALATLHMRVVEMGGLVLDQVREATHAYTNWNAESATRVIERESQVNDYEARLDEEQMTLIARRQPVATDLKIILAVSRSVAELERAGDEAKKIARTVLGHGGRPGPGTSRDARHLGRLAVDLLRLSLEAFDRLDADLATEVIARDQELDEEYAAGLRRLLTRAMEDPRHMEATVEAAFVLKALERIGDHARNLARHVMSINGDTHPLQQATAIPGGTSVGD
ncbi:MAG TPA: phosphate signaling complex protein PhoU [Steroidobacteraceae bacterium]|nr:phosphate signaling complex protein PhoU [Steroidobacteraceae bacterium]